MRAMADGDGAKDGGAPAAPGPAKPLSKRFVALIGAGAVALLGMVFKEAVSHAVKDAWEHVTLHIDAFRDKAPVALGATFREVHDTIGTPSDYSALGEEYFSLGLIVFQQYGKPDVVGGLTALRLPSGVAFEGRLNRIKLGMSFAEVQDVLGVPTFWGIPESHPPVALWKDKDELTFVYFTLAGANGTPTAVQITYCKESSTAAYHAIVSAALQELRAGRVAEYFDEFRSRKDALDIPGDMTFDVFVDRYAHLGYEIVGVEPNLAGGAVVLLLYDNDDLLSVWVYPLGWETPSIRAIVSRSGPVLASASGDKERQMILESIRALRAKPGDQRVGP